MKKTSTVYDYTLGWQTDHFYKPSTTFKNQAYNKNIDPNLKSQDFGAPKINLDNSDNVLINMNELKRDLIYPLTGILYQSSSISALVDSQGIWKYDQKEDFFVRQRNPGQDTIGDIRVRYFRINPEKGLDVTLCGDYCYADRSIRKRSDLKVSFENTLI